MPVNKIDQSLIKNASVENSLADRPSSASLYGSGGLTPKEIKAAYDKLPKLIADHYNALIDAVHNGDFIKELKTFIQEEHTLYDLINDISSGAMASYLRFAEGGSLDDFYADTSKRIRYGRERPTSLTEGVVGGIYVFCAESPAFYVCTAVSGGSYVWKIFDPGVAIEIDSSVSQNSANAVSSAAVFDAIEEKEKSMGEYLAKKPVRESIVLKSDKWSGNAQSIEILSLGANDDIILTPRTKADLKLINRCGLFVSAADSGRIVTFSVDSTPAEDIEMYATIIKG